MRFIQGRMLRAVAPWAIGCALFAMSAERLKAASIAPAFAGNYELVDLGSASGVPANYGGLTLLAGNQNTLLLGGSANSTSGNIYQIGITRDAGGHITGFTGPATILAKAEQIDGGLAYGPGGVLFYTGYPTNTLGQIKPGSSTTDKTIQLNPLSIGNSVGTLVFVPSYASGAGQFKIISYSTGQIYNADLVPDGSGTYNLGNVTLQTALNGDPLNLPTPEGIVYVTPGSPGFSVPTMLVSEYGQNRISAYEVDTNGNPILSTRQDFVTGLFGAEGAFLDPISGDFLFSTYGGGNHVIAIRGFETAVPEPGSLVLVGLGLLGIAGYKARRRHGA